MGHTNATVNYNLPQFVGTDKPSWLGDVNGAFLAIDTAIAAAKTEADSAAGGVAGLQTTVGSHTTQIGNLTDTVTAQGGTLNTVTALIGNGEPTTTDKTLIGAINELNADIVNLIKTWTLDFGTYNNNQYRSVVTQIGNIVLFFYNGARNLTVDTYFQVGTLPTDCPKPTNTVIELGQFGTNYTTVAIRPSGAIEVNSLEGNDYRTGMAMYFIN